MFEMMTFINYFKVRRSQRNLFDPVVHLIATYANIAYIASSMKRVASCS